MKADSLDLVIQQIQSILMCKHVAVLCTSGTWISIYKPAKFGDGKRHSNAKSGSALQRVLVQNCCLYFIVANLSASNEKPLQ